MVPAKEKRMNLLKKWRLFTLRRLRLRIVRASPLSAEVRMMLRHNRRVSIDLNRMVARFKEADHHGEMLKCIENARKLLI